MTKNLKALSKQLFGARYERIGKSLWTGFFLFFALYTAEIRLAVAPFILFFTSAVLTAGVMWQALNASHNAEMLQGFFLLPFESRELTMPFVLAFGGYTLITKTVPVWAIFFAVSEWSVLQIMVALLCGITACFGTAAAYVLLKQKKQWIVALWGVSILGVIFGIRATEAVLLVMIVSLGVAIWFLLFVNPYTFYCPSRSNAIIRRTGKNGSVYVYLLRYLLTNKNYLINTLGLMAVACFLPLLFGQFKELNVMPLGFAILCLNTPICILLSCDPDLEQAVRVLPGQASRFCIRYCLFIFAVHVAVSSIYLCSWQINNGNVTGQDFLAAVLFALQSAILSVLLEWLHPIREWKIEGDLWHHPRKYIVPLLMMLVAAVVGTWPPLIWIWLGVLVLECIGLLFIARRI